MEEVTNKERIRRWLADTINSAKSDADIEAIDKHCALFHGEDAGEYLISQIKAYGCPVYGANGEVVYWEINKQLAMGGTPNHTDMKG